MGQARSQPSREGSKTAAKASAHTTSASRETSPDDPFHRPPIYPTLRSTSLPPPPPKAPTLGTRKSTAKLHKSTAPETDLPTIPAASSLSSRVVRRISNSRKNVGDVRVRVASGSGSGLPSAHTVLHHPDFRPKSYGRYPPPPPATDSDPPPSVVISGSSSSLLTPSDSRWNIVSPITPDATQTPAYQIRPPPAKEHRRNSSASSGKSLSASGRPAPHSPKARTRAEREWRARIAAISARAKASGTGGEDRAESPAYKGPVPPRRRGGLQASIDALPTAPSRVRQPFSAVAPHIDLSDDPSTPLRRSLSSARSFQTLGHHVSAHRRTSFANGSPSHSHYRSVPLPTAGRFPLLHHRAHSHDASPPQSIGSSYSDATSRGGERPSSFAASAFLDAFKKVDAEPSDEAGAATPGADAGGEDEDDLLEVKASGMAQVFSDAKEAHQAAADDLEFDIFFDQPQATATLPTPLLSPIRLQTTTPKSKALPTSTRTPTRSSDANRWCWVERSPPPVVASGQDPKTPRSRTRQLSERTPSFLNINTSPQHTPIWTAVPRFAFPSQPPSPVPTPPLQADTSLNTGSYSPSFPSVLSYALSAPALTKHLASGSAATSTTSHSPMTTYILSAPSIDITFPVQDSVPTSPQGYMKGYAGGGAGIKEEKAESHPFAKVLDAPSPPRVQGGMRAEIEARRAGVRSMGKGALARIRDEENRQSVQLKSAPRYTSRTAPPSPSVTYRSSHPLRPKNPNGLPTARDAVLGAADREAWTRGNVDADLCPGTGDGGSVRPRKTGMGKSDLEKWLRMV